MKFQFWHFVALVGLIILGVFIPPNTWGEPLAGKGSVELCFNKGISKSHEIVCTFQKSENGTYEKKQMEIHYSVELTKTLTGCTIDGSDTKGGYTLINEKVKDLVNYQESQKKFLYLERLLTIHCT
jgi:hypothetical protein